MQVLVVVKASPQPSAKYGDTVCVAGVLMTDKPRWIRLYPVPFRYLDGPQQFSKYSVINVTLHEATTDQRPESAKISVDSVDVGDVVPPWRLRAPFVEPLVGTTMCELIAGVKSNINSESLGAIRPSRVDPRLRFDNHGPWSQKQESVLRAAASQGELFGPQAHVLEPPRLIVKLHYWCISADCTGHEQRIIDWELTALQRRGSRLTDEDLKASISDRFMSRMFLADTEPIIFVGNQADVVRRQSFTVLGVITPSDKIPLNRSCSRSRGSALRGRVGPFAARWTPNHGDMWCGRVRNRVRPRCPHQLVLRHAGLPLPLWVRQAVAGIEIC